MILCAHATVSLAVDSIVQLLVSSIFGFDFAAPALFIGVSLSAEVGFDQRYTPITMSLWSWDGKNPTGVQVGCDLSLEAPARVTSLYKP